MPSPTASKSLCSPVAAPMLAMYCADIGSTSAPEMSLFHGFDAGNTVGHASLNPGTMPPPLPPEPPPPPLPPLPLPQPPVANTSPMSTHSLGMPAILYCRRVLVAPAHVARR